MADTIAAIATGNAPGGIGVIRISGDTAIETAEKVFCPADKSSLSDLGGYRAKYGNVIINSQKADNAVALVFRAPKSYTGEDVVEISVHGGLLLIRKTLEAVLSAGARLAQPGEFTKRAFLNGKMDLTQAESVAAVISSQGEQALKASYNALDGNLSRKINAVTQKLLDCSALMAAWVDYPDEEIPELSDEELSATLTDVKSQLQSLLDGYENGQILKNGVNTVIAGRPNVGKSSLMNMLTGTDKSIVTQIEGTTRDIVEDDILLGDIVLHLSDTAGLRKSTDEVEEIGIKKAYKAIDGAQLVLAVFDAAQTLDDYDVKLIKKLKGKTALAVINKTDLETKADTLFIEKNFLKTVYISAANGEGFDSIKDAVGEILGVSDFDCSAPLLANSRQKNNCKNALEYVNQALDALYSGVTFDALNVMIDAAADELLSLTGKKATTEVVNNIFSKFCVGK